MEDLKTVLFYILGLAGLIIASVIFTRQAEVVVNELPTATPANQVAWKPTITTSTEINQPDCVFTAMSITYSYIPNAPFTTTLASPDLKGDRLIVSGTVYASNRVTPLPGALIEVWQANAEGRYGRLRGQMWTDVEGHYEFTTIKPGHYQVDCLPMPAHIHYRITYLNNDPIFQTLFFQGDPYLTNILIEPTFIRPLTARMGSDGPVLDATFDIALPVNLGSADSGIGD